MRLTNYKAENEATPTGKYQEELLLLTPTPPIKTYVFTHCITDLILLTIF